MAGTGVDERVTAVLDAARDDIIAARRARFQLLERIAELRACDAATHTGYRTSRRLIQDLWHLDAGEAGRLIADADVLTARTTLTGEPLPPVLPATAAAAADGLLGEHHLRVIRRAVEHLDRAAGIDPDTLAAAEQVLARIASTLPPKALEKAAHRLVSELDPDGAAPPEDPELGDELLVHFRPDHSVAFTARLHGKIEVEMIREVLDALATPAGPDDTRTLAQRRAEALKDLFAQALTPTGLATEEDHGEDHGDRPEACGDDDRTADDTADDTAGDAAAEARIPAPRQSADDPARSTRPGCPTVRIGGQALLTITMDHRWLQQQIGHGVLDSDTPVHPSTVRRWACDACVVPVVLGTGSQPLDIGRLTRTVPDGMRRALIQRDGGCSFPGCTRRPRRCHAHHLKHWVDHGETKLENLTLLCRFHHSVIHHDQWSVAMIRGRPWFTPPPWVDPDRIPRPGGRHPVATAA
jgi:hypothetical protein